MQCLSLTKAHGSFGGRLINSLSSRNAAYTSKMMHSTLVTHLVQPLVV